MALQTICQSVQEEGAVFVRGTSIHTVKKTRSGSATEDSGGWGGKGIDKGMGQEHLEGLQSHAVGHTTSGLRSPPAAPQGQKWKGHVRNQTQREKQFSRSFSEMVAEQGVKSKPFPTTVQEFLCSRRCFL